MEPNNYDVLEHKLNQMRLGLIVLATCIAMLGVTIGLDYFGADIDFMDGQVITHKLMPAQPIPVTDPCFEETQFADCTYLPVPSESYYGILAGYGNQADVFAVPRSYFYSTDKNDMIPIVQRKGLLSGIIYSKRIVYPIQRDYEHSQ